MGMSSSEREELEFSLGQYFKPTMPINREDLFSGRRAQAREILDAINQPGQHVILYGERGVGKTSLANMLMFRAQCPGAHVLAPHVNCTGKVDSNAIWTALLDDIAYRADKDKIALPRSVKKAVYDFQNELRIDFTSEMARRIVTDLSDANMVVILIIDEFDTITDDATRQHMAETIKYFSDRNIPGTIVLIGVADDVETLIAEHRSIERCVAQVRMPRMSRDEIEAIVTTSLGKAGMTIERGGLHEVSRIAIGLPQYAHLLGLHAGRLAVEEGLKTITQGHVSTAARTATSRAQVTIQSAYSKATISTKKNALYKQVLLACALARTDEFGYFAPSDVREPLERILKRVYGIEAFARHLHAFSEPERGPVLKKMDWANRPRFRFDNPLMQPFVVMKGLDEGILSDDDLRATRDPNDDQGRLF
ncbi:MAG: ATP-binding protein [Pirellulales bacterium]